MSGPPRSGGAPPNDAESYLDRTRMPLPFCPGCGHSHILPALDEALQRRATDPARIVLVTDIGCAGLSDQYFRTSALHGLHGRSFTYATGIKLARPELQVIVLVGDGGCGIGAGHLLHAARRNIGITVVVFNNFNFGMTGGQHSTTTPAGALTSTTRDGNLEAPLDIAGTVAPSRPSFVARTSTFDSELADLLAEALETPGFALVDVWEQCTAHFGPRNRLNRTKLEGWMDELGMPRGVLVRSDRPEFARAVRDAVQAPGGPPELAGFEVGYEGELEAPTSILLAGDAGQRIQSAAEVFATAAVASDLFATHKGVYPVTVRTGFSLADLVLSPDPVEFTGVESPAFAVVVGEAGLEKAKGRLSGMSPDGRLLVDVDLPRPRTDAEVVRLPLVETARRSDRHGVATVALSALLASTGWFPLDALEWAARRRFADDVAERVVACCRAGFELGEADLGAPSVDE